jgi:hypothetical protein
VVDLIDMSMYTVREYKRGRTEAKLRDDVEADSRSKGDREQRERGYLAKDILRALHTRRDENTGHVAASRMLSRVAQQL